MSCAILFAAERAQAAELVRYYSARAPEYDDWYLRRGRYSHGPLDDAAWQAELAVAAEWLKRVPFHGEIVELAAGTGWWSPILAAHGKLSAYDAVPEALDRARARLAGEGLRAEVAIRDAWALPDRLVDGLFCGFWVSHVPRPRLPQFLELVRLWLRAGGTFAFIDSLLDPRSGASDHPKPAGDLSIRRVRGGGEFEIVKVYYEPEELGAALSVAGFDGVDIGTTGRFFLLGTATRPMSPQR